MKKLIVIIPVLAVMAAAIWFIVDMAQDNSFFNQESIADIGGSGNSQKPKTEGVIFKAKDDKYTNNNNRSKNIINRPSSEDDPAYSQLHIAAEKGDFTLVKQLLKDGANIDARNSAGMTPLALAMLRKNNEIAELLISEGADIQARDKVDNSMLHVATFSGMSKIASGLIEKGIDVNAKNKAGETPLFEAVRQGNLTLAKLFLENGAKPNTSNILGKTALHLAAEKGNKEIVTLLLENGADPKAVYTTQEGDEVSVLDSARKEEIKEIIEDYISK